MKPKISLITVCRNSEATIEKALQSVVSQTYDNIEYIVIDGDSGDLTKEIIEQYKDRIHYYISEPDKNWADAMNKGILAATGDYVGFVNSDDYLFDNNVVEDVVQVINSNQNCLIFYGDAEIRPNPRFSNDITIFKPPTPEQLIDNLTLNIGPFMGASYYSREVFATVGCFGVSFDDANDTEWFLRFFEHWDANSFYYYPRTIFSYSMCGHSSKDVGITLKAAFEFIDNAPILQTEYWLKRRTKNLQEKVIFLEKLYHETQDLSLRRLRDIERLEGDVQRLEGVIERLEGDRKEITRKIRSTQRLKNLFREKIPIPIKNLLKKYLHS